MAIPDIIKSLANKVRNEIYGRDVRESIAKSMEVTGETAEEAKQRSIEQLDRVDRLIRENPQPSEVVDARGNHPILRDRLNSVDAQLAQTPKYPILEYEKINGTPIVVNVDYPYDDVKRYGIVADYVTSEQPYTNNYEAFNKLMEIAQDGQTFYFNENGDYYFEGSEGLNVEKQINLIGKDRPKLRIKSENGQGITFFNRNSKFENCIVQGYDKTKGSGVRFIGVAPDYNAYCSVKNVESINFLNGFYFGDVFYLTTEDLIAHNCDTGFIYDNVATMLFSKNCYARSCDNGHRYRNIYYSTIINPACDHATNFAYNISKVRSTNFSGVGFENNSKFSLDISESVISINGLTADRSFGTSGSGSVMSIRDGSEVVLTDAYERIRRDDTESQSSIVVDGTSVLNILNSNLIGDIFVGSGGQINGTAKINNQRRYYDRANRIYYGTTPPSEGTHRTGDKVINTSVNVNTNPVMGWVCIAGGSPGDWRPYGHITNRGTLANRPNLNGFNHIGVQYVVTEDGKREVITWDGTFWVNSEGTIVS